MKFLSWNINGIRAASKKGLWKKINELNPDIICLQETKAGEDVMQTLYPKFIESKQNLFEENTTKFQLCDQIEWVFNWQSSTVKKGYSGVLIGVKREVWEKSEFVFLGWQEGLNKIEFDQEGRLIGLKFNYQNQKIALLNGYYPQGGRGQYRIDYKLQYYAAILELGKNLQKQGFDLILTGDFNTTINDIDLARPKDNRKNTGCLPEERLALNWFLKLREVDLKNYQERKYFTKNLQASAKIYKKLKMQTSDKSLNLIDTFRYFYPDLEQKYTYWDQKTRARDRNVGWRIDMFLVSQGLKKYFKSAQILDQIMGSDHCPIWFELDKNQS